jgi:hypothetical protein
MVVGDNDLGPLHVIAHVAGNQFVAGVASSAASFDYYSPFSGAEALRQPRWPRKAMISGNLEFRTAAAEAPICNQPRHPCARRSLKGSATMNLS